MDAVEVTLGPPIKDDGKGLKGIRAQRAATLGRQYANAFTPEEVYRYQQVAGQKTREAVKQLRAASEAGRVDAEELQDRLKVMVTAGRKVAKREVMIESQK
jgi:hypothetical protein